MIASFDYSPVIFNLRLAGFRRAVERYPEFAGLPFERFDTGPVAKWEAYKEEIAREAERRLGAKAWHSSQIGTGQILTRVIDAIEIDEGRYRTNNLVQWQVGRYGESGQSHRAMIDARADLEERRRAENLLFRLYHERQPPPETFDELTGLFRPRYDLIAYLCFIWDWAEYMPTKPTIFSEAFELLGMPHPMSHRCSWENYQGYLERLRVVKWLLRENGFPDARLIDSHSFCFMLVHPHLPQVPVERNAVFYEFQPEAAAPPRGGAESTLRDFESEDRARRRIGRIAESVVLEAERDRLVRLGRPDLAEDVADVSAKAHLGYDIASFTPDGERKPVEVKAVAHRGEALRFFLSENEYARSRDLPNYTFALVVDPESSEPMILECLGQKLEAEALRAVKYEVRLQAPPSAQRPASPSA